MTPFLSGSLWGYKNTAGEIAIPAQFTQAEAFAADADVAFAAQNGAFGLIDRNGLWVVEPMWSAYLPFSEGRAAVENGDKWGFVDTSGALVIDYQFREVGSFSCGRAMARTGSSYGYIDPLGNMAVSEKFRFAGAFDGDVAFASAGDSSYIINKAGTPQYTLDAGVTGDHFSEDFALVQKNGIFYYISQYARQVFDGEFSDARSFSGGMAAVQIDGLWGYINTEGDISIRAQFYGAQDFSEGMAAVQNMEGFWGYINRSGSLRIDYAYSVAEPFLDGYARVKRGFGLVAAEYRWRVAHAMVAKYGMSDQLGAVVYDDQKGEVFIGRSMAQSKPYSESVAAAIDHEVKTLIDRAYEKCQGLLKQYLPQLEITAQYLLEHETMSAADFEAVFSQDTPGALPLDPQAFKKA